MKGKRNGKQPPPQPKAKNQIKVSHNTFLRIQERAEPIVDNGNDVIARVFKEANEMRRIDPENPEYWEPRKLRSGARKRRTSPPTIQREESPITEPLNYMTRPVPETNLLDEIQRDTHRTIDTLRLQYERRATTRLPGTKPPPVTPTREPRIRTLKNEVAIKSPEYQIPTLRALSELPHGRATTRQILSHIQGQMEHAFTEADLTKKDTRATWKHRAQQARRTLEMDGMILKTGRSQIWSITHEGRQMLKQATK